VPTCSSSRERWRRSGGRGARCLREFAERRYGRRGLPRLARRSS
jgi:hypothetical protein